MAMSITTFDESTAARLVRMLRDHERRPPEIGNRHGRDVSAQAREIRWGRTTTNYYYPTYPSAGPAYVVEFGDYSPSPDPPYPGATVTNTFTPYDPAWQEIAVDPSNGTLIAEGTVVRIERHDGRYWIRPAASGVIVPAHVCSSLGSSNQVYQDGSATADTSPYQLTSAGIWCFPSITGTTGNSLGTSIQRNTPSNYDTEWVALLQKTNYIITIHTQWALPSLSLANAQSLFRATGHSHSYTDDGVGATTGTTTPDARSLDEGGIVQITTYVKKSNGGGEFYLGSSTLRPFYDSAGGYHVASHSGSFLISNTGSPAENLRIHIVRDDSTAYVLPELYGGTYTLQQTGSIEAY